MEEEEEVVTRLMHLQPGASLVTPALPRGAKLDNADYKREKTLRRGERWSVEEVLTRWSSILREKTGERIQLDMMH